MSWTTRSGSGCCLARKTVLLMVASDRISAFDVVLPVLIPNKGAVLNQLSAFWFEKTRDLMENHLIAVFKRRLVRLPVSNHLRFKGPVWPLYWKVYVGEEGPADRYREYSAGSIWRDRHGRSISARAPYGTTVCLWDLGRGELLPQPIFTPTTKAEEGHDRIMTRQQVSDMVGEDLAGQIEQKSLALYSFAHDYALQKGIIVADTKMEFGLLDGRLILIDELLTPDSSRFWDADGYEPGRSLPSYDKQYVRDWLDSQGWDREPPAPSLPEEVVQKTTQRYIEAYRRLTGRKLPTPEA